MNRTALFFKPLLTLLLCCWGYALWGQLGIYSFATDQVEEEIVACRYSCISVKAEGLPPEATSIKWTVVPLIGDGQTLTDHSEIFEFCENTVGLYKITLQALDNDLSPLESAELLLEVMPFELPSTAYVEDENGSITYLPDPEHGECQKVCEGDVITYGYYEYGWQIILNQNGIAYFLSGQVTFNVGFWVTGGSSTGLLDMPEGSFGTVTWGEPGLGSYFFGYYAPDNLPGYYLPNTYMNDGCEVDLGGCVEILPKAKVEIVSDPPAVNEIVQICLGESVSFSNSYPETTRLQWFFGNNLVTDELNPTYTFNEPGTYEIILRGENELECGVATDKLKVVVADNPESLTLDCMGTVCPGDTVTYSVNPFCTQLQWIVSDNAQVLNGGTPGSDSITVVWTGGVQGTIEVDAQACALDLECGNIEEFTIPILSDDLQIMGPAVACRGEIHHYYLPESEGTVFEWITQNGQIQGDHNRNFVEVRWSSLNSPRKLIVNYESCFLGCSGTDTLEVEVRLPFAIAGQRDICPSESYTYYSKLSNDQDINCYWQLLDEQGMVLEEEVGSTANWTILSPSNPGDYLIVATPVDPDQSCFEQVELPLSVTTPLETPIINGPEVICPGMLQQYQALVGSNAAVEWTIIDGDLRYERDEKSINVIWGTEPPRMLLLRQRPFSGQGCYSLRDTVEVQTPTLASLSGPEQVCVESIGTYTFPNIDGVYFQWEVIPNELGSVITASPTDSVQILWHQPGNAMVKLTVCGGTIEMPVTIDEIAAPVLSYESPICEGTTTLVQVDGDFAEYQWLDEDGILVSTAPAPELGPGDYQLICSNLLGCEQIQAFSIGALPLPKVHISTPQLTGYCNQTPYNEIHATIADPPLNYQWYYNGTPTGGNTPSIVGTLLGDYRVEVTDENGCTNFSNKISLVLNCNNPGDASIGLVNDPYINFLIIPEADCMERSYEMDVSIPAEDIEWSFNDPESGSNNTAVGETAFHRYTEPGFYPVNMYGIFTHPNFSLPINAYITKPDTAKLLADFSCEINCVGQPTQFQDQSRFLSITNIVQWDWNFGDPASGGDNVASVRNPEHIYQNPGTYSIELVVTEASGCTSSFVQEIEILPLPTAVFNPPLANCALTALQFSLEDADDILIAHWDFGDPNSGAANLSQRIQPYHVYAEPGEYEVSVEVEDVRGCTGTYSRTITVVENNLTGDISPMQPEPVCEGDTTIFTAPPGGIAWQWTTGETTEQIAATLPGRYSVTITGPDHCTYIPHPVQHSIIPAPTAELIGQTLDSNGVASGHYYEMMQVCEGTSISIFSKKGPQFPEYFWSVGLGPNELIYDGDRNDLLEPGTHEFSVTVTDYFTGCSTEEGPFTVEVIPAPETPVLASDPEGNACGYEEQTFFVTNASTSLSYLWSNGEDSTSISVLYPGQYTVTATDPTGCYSVSEPVNKQLEPNLHQIPVGCHSVCRPAEICVAPIDGVVSYQWYFEGQAINGATEPSLDAETDGTYYLEVLTAEGCAFQSDPLDLTFYEGIGNFVGNVYYDQNQNGLVDAEDSLLLGIDILLELETGSLTSTTDSSGYAFMGVRSGIYNFQLDTTSLPPYLYASIWEQQDVVSCSETTELNWLINCVPSESTLTLTACQGDSILVYDQYLTPGTELDFTLTNAHGCDSMVNVKVEALRKDTSLVQLSACANGTATYANTEIPAGASESFLLQNSLGCDSLVMVEVTALPLSLNELIMYTCPDVPIVYEGTSLGVGNQGTFHFTNQFGCDSTVFVDVLPFPESASELTLHTCPNTPIIYDGVPLEVGAEQVFHFNNQYGCDSVVTVLVEALRQDTVALQLSACANGTASYANTEIPAGTTESFIWQNSEGCDSMVVVNVMPLPLDTSRLDLQVCEGGTVTYAGQLLSSGVDEWFPLQNQNGCDSLVNVRVTTFPRAEFAITTEASCPNENSGSIYFQMNEGTPPFRYSLDDGDWQPTAHFTDLAGGQHLLRIEDGNGCQTEEVIVVETMPLLIVTMQDATLPCESAELTLAPAIQSGDDGQLSYRWNDGSNFPELTVTTPGSYSVEVQNLCESQTREIEVRWQEIYLEDYFYLPNAFSPNDDGVNDRFRILPAEDVVVLEFKLLLFDRWGNLMYRSTDWQDGWDGDFRTRPLDPGVYVYYVTAKVLLCGQETDLEYAGDVALMR